MTSLHTDSPFLVVTSATEPAPQSLDTGLLPGPADLVTRLAERLTTADEQPAALLVVGLLRRDTGWPLTSATITTVTALIAGAVRADDWLARKDVAEFGVLVGGGPDVADAVAARLAGVVTGAITGLHACVGVAALEPGLTAHEVDRRAVLCLDAARHRGPNTIIRYRGVR